MNAPLKSDARYQADRIERIDLSLTILPLKTPVSDAKVTTGRQKPLTQVAFLFVEIDTADGLRGLGFSYSKRAGLPLAKLLGAHRDTVACYNTSGGFLSTPIEQMLDNIDAAVAQGIGGVKIKVGQPDTRADLKRLEAVQKRLDGRAALMVDANQQWDRATALRMGRAMDGFGMVWIEEPLDAYDVEGHAALAAALDTSIASGEMLASAGEHLTLIRAGAVDIIQPDAPRVGGVSQFMRVLAAADERGLGLAPHFAMEIHVHLAATYPREPWVEHFDWLEPLFNERMEIDGGRMVVPRRPGLGVTLSEQARAWTVERETVS